MRRTEDMTPVDGEADHLGKGLREKGRRDIGDDIPSVVAQRRLGQGMRGRRLELPEGDQTPLQGCGGHTQRVRGRVQPGDQFRLGQPRPIREPLQDAARHQNCPGEVVGQLLDAIAAGLPRFFAMLGRHRIPGEDVEQLVGEIEMPAAGDFAARDQHRVQLGQAAGRSRDAVACVDHEHHDAEIPLYYLGEARRRFVPETELGGEPISCLHGILETGMTGESEGPAHERSLAPDPRRQEPERGDPASGVAFVLFEPPCIDAGLAPGKEAFADQKKRIGEVFQGSAELFDREHQFLRSNAPEAGLDGRNGLSIPEAEKLGKAVLGEPALFAQRLDPRAYELFRHSNLRVLEILANSILQ